MSDLPASWIITTLGEITADCAQKIPGETEAFQYIDISSVDRQTKAIVSPQSLTGANAPSRARKLVQTGDVLVSLTRPNLNAVALVPKYLDGQIASTGFDVLRAKEIDPRWIFNAVRTTDFVNTVSNLVQGALYPAIRSKDVRGYELPLAPLNEQRRIADKLDVTLARVDACRERLDRVVAILKRFRQSVLAAAVSGKLTEEWREEKDQTSLSQNQSFIFATPSHISEIDIPSEWIWVSLCDLVTNFDNKRIPIRSSDREKRKGQYPYYGAFGVIDSINDFIYDGDFVLLAEDGKNLESRDRPIALIAKGKFWVNNHAHVLKPHKNLLQEYLTLYMNSPILDLSPFLTGIDQVKLTRSAMDRISIPLPSLEEQAEIVRRVESLFSFADRLEASLATGNARVANLTPALLAKAFRGELVPQYPNDEPADVLLERIRAARAGASEKGKKATVTTRATRPPKTTTVESMATGTNASPRKRGRPRNVIGSGEGVLDLGL